MIRVLGIFFAVILAGVPVLVADALVGNGFLANFITNQSFSIMATMLGFNIATSAFLVGHLTNIELQLRKSIFKKSRRELRQNLVFMFVVFLIYLILLTATPKEPGAWTVTISSASISIFTAASLFLFMLYMFAVFELTKAIFSVDKILPEQSVKSK
jgi:hypothetical protein